MVLGNAHSSAPRFQKPIGPPQRRQWIAWIPNPIDLRTWLTQCIAEYAHDQERTGGYDVDIALLACARVEDALANLPISRNAALEYVAICQMLEALRERDDLHQGELSTEAASFGSLLGRFQAIEVD